MGKIIKILTALILLASICFTGIVESNYDFDDVSTAGTIVNSIPLNKKKKVFSKDYKTTVNGISLIAKKGVNYTNYKLIKKAINETPKEFIELLDEIVITTQHPILELNPNPSPAQKELIKSQPDVGGLHSYSTNSKIILRDSDNIIEVYVHELFHNIDYISRTKENSIRESKSLKDLYAKVTKKSKEKDGIEYQWISSLSKEEFLSYMAEFYYTDNDEVYHTIITKEYPEVGRYLDKLVNSLISTASD